MTYNAKYFGDLFVAAARSDAARRSYKGGVDTGTGNIPYDTGRTQNSIYVSRASDNVCVVEIGGDAAPYAFWLEYADNVGRTSVVNRHKGFVERFSKTDFVRVLEKMFGEVKLK